MSQTENNLKKFDWEVYLLNYPDLVDLKTRQDATRHYLHIGHLENRTDDISPSFDAQKYLKTYSHLWLKTERDAYIHFMKLGVLYTKEKSTNPLHVLLFSQYKKIVEQNRNKLRDAPEDVEPFVLPPAYKIPTPTELRLPAAPRFLKPPDGPLKLERRTQPIVEKRPQPRSIVPIEMVKRRPMEMRTSFLIPKTAPKKPMVAQEKVVHPIPISRRPVQTPMFMLAPKQKRVVSELKTASAPVVRRPAQPPSPLLPPKIPRRVVVEGKPAGQKTMAKTVTFRRPSLQLWSIQKFSRQQPIRQFHVPVKKNLVIDAPRRPAVAPSAYQMIAPRPIRKTITVESKATPSVTPSLTVYKPPARNITTTRPKTFMSPSVKAIKSNKVHQSFVDAVTIREPPSVYFGRMGKTINPPVYLN